MILMLRTSYSGQILMKLTFSRQIKKISNMTKIPPMEQSCS